MTWHVLKKEIISKIGTPRVLIIYIVTAALIISAFISGTINYLNIRSETKEFAKAEKQRLSAVTNYFEGFVTKGVELYREPSPLTILVAGIEGDSARRGVANLGSYADFNTSKFNTTPILAVFGWLDLEFIVKIILSLFAIIFAYDAVCGEKETGTFRLILANGIKRNSIILGKYLGNLVLFFIPIVLAFIIGLIIVITFPEIQFDGEVWVRVSLIIAAFLLYLVTFFSLSMMVSTLTHKSNISFLILLMMWLLFIGVVPRASVLAAQVLQPVPSIEVVKREFASELSSGQQKIMSSIKDIIKRLQREAMPLVGKLQSGEMSREEFDRLIQDKRNELMQTIADELDKFTTRTRERGYVIAREQDQKQNLQNNQAVLFSRLTSPAAALTFSVERLAKAGVDSSDKVFRKTVDEFTEQLSQFNREILKNNPEFITSSQQPGGPPTDLSRVYPDESKFQQERLEISVSEAIMDFTVMAFLSLIFTTIAFMGFSRYDVR